MFDATDKVSKMRDDIAVCQATIDQARQHLENNKGLFSDAMVSNFKRGLMERQMKLDIQKRQVDLLFPK